MHRCLVNTVVVWLHILGTYWYMCVALFGSSRINHTPMYFNGLF
jgi:hypothetical protein